MGAKKKNQKNQVSVAEKIEEKTVCPVFKLLGAHMIVCFRPFFLRLLKRKKKQKHLEFNVKVARAFIPHMYRYHPPLPHPF